MNAFLSVTWGGYRQGQADRHGVFHIRSRQVQGHFNIEKN
jgi:hypothetical protein